MPRTFLWQLLLDRGLFADRKMATSWIMAGRVIVDGQRLDKAGHLISPRAHVRVKGLDRRYVGRGGVKLAGALAAFDMDVAGQVALDAGAAVGGFTDCLLQQGAAKVYAVDVGYAQLAGTLRADRRVCSLERTNISDLRPDALRPHPSLAVVDLSYLSLRQAIPIIAPLLAPTGEMVCLVKPLFEVADSEVRRTGQIDDPAVYRTVLQSLTSYAASLGLTATAVAHSPITGRNGTREFFLRIGLAQSAERPVRPGQLDAAVESVMALSPHNERA